MSSLGPRSKYRPKAAYYTPPELAEAAIRLFYAMREMDEMGLDEIIAEPVTETGLGVAIMDRLRRASAR